MASLYLKDGWFYLTWGHGIEKQQKALRIPAHERAKAERLKKELERELAAEKKLGLGERRTFGGYRRLWAQQRKSQGIATAHDEHVRLSRHASALDTMRLEEIRPRHLKALILDLRRKGTLAPRTIRHVFGAIHRLFQDAIMDELVVANPAVLPTGVLPPVEDADPKWRPTAIFSRAEVETLITDILVPEQRRMLYATLFLTGARIGEVAALTWADYLQERQPLGALIIGASYQRKTGKVKSTKTRTVREVPVHPVLASMLASWKLSGWGEYLGQPKGPKAEDLLLPTYRGTHMRDPVVHRNLLFDLEKLGLRPRRTHDARRTFISLALEDGANRDALKRVTHGMPTRVFDLYTTFSWPALCEAVGHLNVRARLNPTPALLPTTTHKKG